MNCIICSKPSVKTINCIKNGISISLCTEHADECDTCRSCKINFSGVLK